MESRRRLQQYAFALEFLDILLITDKIEELTGYSTQRAVRPGQLHPGTVEGFRTLDNGTVNVIIGGQCTEGLGHRHQHQHRQQPIEEISVFYSYSCVS